MEDILSLPGVRAVAWMTTTSMNASGVQIAMVIPTNSNQDAKESLQYQSQQHEQQVHLLRQNLVEEMNRIIVTSRQSSSTTSPNQEPQIHHVWAFFNNLTDSPYHSLMWKKINIEKAVDNATATDDNDGYLVIALDWSTWMPTSPSLFSSSTATSTSSLRGSNTPYYRSIENLEESDWDKIVIQLSSAVNEATMATCGSPPDFWNDSLEKVQVGRDDSWSVKILEDELSCPVRW